jgi:hypothetical protein
MNDGLAHLPPGNTETVCIALGDNEGFTGRAHAWKWESAESNYRICTTCGRREWNSRVNPHDTSER